VVIMRPLGANRQDGFTLLELLIASSTTVVLLAGAVAITSQVQNGYRRQIEDGVAEQEGRYALDWIGRYIRGADSNPFNVTESDCPGAETDFEGVIIDPNGDGTNDDITLQTDSNPPDGMVGGDGTDCTQANEHVTISLDDANDTIVFLDEAVGEAATTRTDSVIEDLEFVYRDDERNITAVSANVLYVETRITVRSRTPGANGQPVTRVLTSETRVRSR